MLEVLLDPRLELLGVLDLLDPGRKPAFVPPALAYAKNIERAFAPFKNHAAVTLNAEWSKDDPDQSRRKDALMKRSAPPALVFDETMSSNRGEDERSGKLEPWLAALREFTKDSRFMKAFAACAKTLEPELSALRARAEQADYIGKLERYTGETYDGRYVLLASPLCQKGGVLNRIWSRDDGTSEILSVLKPEPGPDGKLTFVDEDLDACVWHELAHGVLDLTANLYHQEEQETPLDLGPGLARNCRNWLHGMREHLVRSVMIRLIALESGEKEGEKRLKQEDFSEAPYLKAFVELLKEYEKSRSKYPTVSDFYPRLVAAFPKPAAKPKGAAAAGSIPFYTEGQRAAVLKRLDRLLLTSKDARLVARRASLA